MRAGPGRGWLDYVAFEELENQDPAQWCHQAQKTNGVSEKPRGEQQRAGDEQAEALEHLHGRHDPPVHLAAHPLQGGNALRLYQQGANDGGENDQGNSRQGADIAADLDEQADLDHGHYQEDKE